MPSSAREEAERLVAAVLAMASTGAGKGNDGLGALGDLVGKVAGAAFGQGSGGSWATGSAECCVCPICRAISAMRDPSPDTAAKLAVGAGDLAHGVASMMRALSAISGERPAPPAKPASQRPSPDEAWSAATRKDRGDTGRDDVNNADEAWAAATNGPAPDPESDPWGAASAASAEAVRAERRAAAKAAADAAAEAARRVREAAAQAKAAREAAQAKREPDTDVVQNTTPEVAPPGRTPQRFDVWAAATAADLERKPDVDHDDRDGAGDLS
ncbi:hypothetical protein [Actinoplanes sp. TBRC 11911]|uniref:hypothetical protein n=1 Tax=Actinoplanes sp. TBRC 11911 TaxID=2729386 RepID=UPI0020070904|nr:hypothetical protein [Actinoplanes sp. TBRC 11911]